MNEDSPSSHPDRIPGDPIDAQTASALPDAEAKKEIDDVQVDRLKQEVATLATDRQQRVQYAQWVFYLMCAWLAGVGVLLLLQGFGARDGWFRLADAVLISLVTGVSVNIIGTFAIVMTYLFRRTAPIDPLAMQLPRKPVDS